MIQFYFISRTGAQFKYHIIQIVKIVLKPQCLHSMVEVQKHVDSGLNILAISHLNEVRLCTQATEELLILIRVVKIFAKNRTRPVFLPRPHLYINA